VPLSGDFPFSGGLSSRLSSVEWDGAKLEARHDTGRTAAEKDMSRQHVCWWEGQLGLHLALQKLR